MQNRLGPAGKCEDEHGGNAKSCGIGSARKAELQLTILAVVSVLVLAGGLAAFMYPLVFLHPFGNNWTVRLAFFGFCLLTLLFVGYLLERQRTVRQLKQQLLAELERNVTLQHQASVDPAPLHAGPESFLGPPRHGVPPRHVHTEDTFAPAGEGQNRSGSGKTEPG